MRLRPILVALALLAVAGLLAACGGTDGHAAAACQPPEPPASVPARTPTVAVLVAAGQPPAIVKPVVDGAVRVSAQIRVDALTPAGAQDSPAAVSTLLVPEGPNDLMRQADLRCKTSAVTTALRTIERGRPTGTADIVEALVALHDELEPEGREVDVVIVAPTTSRTPLSGGGAVDLRDARTLADPAVTINVLARANVNFDCSHWQVTLLGRGVRRDGRPMSVDEDAAVQQFWARYFSHCGGTLVHYGSKLVDFPARGAVGDPDATLMPVVQRRAHEVVATMNGNILFTTGSARLLPRADAGLRRVASLITRARGVIEVEGHTDTSGTDAINVPLSRARAAAVAAWLARSGVARDRLVVRGFGSSRPVASNATAAGRARNRRVVVTVHDR